MGEVVGERDAALSGFDEASCAPTPVNISLGDVFKQIGRDLFDKEVQSAATYSYLWMADQMGHIALGLFVIFALSWISYAFGFAVPPEGWWLALIGAAVVAVWEIKAYFAYAAMWTGLFPSNNPLLARNALAATIYMAIGVVLGFTWQTSTEVAAPASFALMAVAVGLGLPWVRQKIIWQKAGLPFLFRLANAYKTITKDDALKLQALLDEHVRNPRCACGPIVVLTGQLGAGKTSLACGVGTEAAFRKLKVRYTTFDKLAQMAATKDDPGPDNISYWPWMESELVIIDDIQSGSWIKPHRTLDRFTHIFEHDFGAKAKCLGKRMTVWVLGPMSADELHRWVKVIKRVCGAPEAHPQVLAIPFVSGSA